MLSNQTSYLEKCDCVCLNHYKTAQVENAKVSNKYGAEYHLVIIIWKVKGS